MLHHQISMDLHGFLKIGIQSANPRQHLHLRHTVPDGLCQGGASVFANIKKISVKSRRLADQNGRCQDFEKTINLKHWFSFLNEGFDTFLPIGMAGAVADAVAFHFKLSF